MGSQDVLPLNLIALLSWGHDKRKAKDLFIGGETRLVSGKAARGTHRSKSDNIFRIGINAAERRTAKPTGMRR